MSQPDGDQCYFEGHKYEDLVQGFRSDTARCMIRCLNESIEAQPTDCTPYNPDHNDWPRIVEFLALTHIAESNHGKRDYARSRTLGMNKLARQLLRSIAAHTVTFDQTFGSYKNVTSYPPILGGGTARARYAVRYVTRNTVMDIYEHGVRTGNRIVEVGRCNELSEDSDNSD